MSFWDIIKNTALGGLAGAGYSAYKGGAFDPQKLSSLSPEQQQLFEHMSSALQGGGGPLADLYNFDPEKTRDQFTQQYAEPAYQQFQEEVIPGITGQFRGQNLQNSSYLGGGLAKAGSDVQSNLNSQLSKMLMEAEQGALGRKQSGLQNMLNMQTFAYKDSPLMSLLNSLAGGAGKAAGAYAGGMF